MPETGQSDRTTDSVGDGEYEFQFGDSLEALAAEHGLISKVIWEHEANAALREAREEPVRIRPGDRLHIPEPRRREESRPTEDCHRFVRKLETPPKPFETCVCLQGISFRFNRSFVRPEASKRVEELRDALAEHPQSMLLVFCHADKVGGEEYNKKLSDRRAATLRALLEHDVDHWEAAWKREGWGLRNIQEMLLHLGMRYDPGPPDGIQGPLTRSAVKEFQKDEGLKVDGIAGPNTRGKLFLRYFESMLPEPVAKKRFIGPGHMGCSEFNPVVNTEEAYEPNRRAVVLLIDPAKKPDLPCRHGDIAPCRNQMADKSGRKQATFRCRFYDDLTAECACQHNPAQDWIDISLVDEFGQPAEGADYVVYLADGSSRSGTLDKEGRARIEDVPPGPYWVEFPTEYDVEDYVDEED